MDQGGAQPGLQGLCPVSGTEAEARQVPGAPTCQEPEDAYPVAYCAPGRRPIAELLLAARGESVARIVEHPWLEGADGIYVAAENPLDLTGQLPVRYEFSQPRSWLGGDWAYGALVNTPRQLAILPGAM
jgi:hypothetical protein